MVQKQKVRLSMLRCSWWKDLCELADYDFVQDVYERGYLGNLVVQSTLKECIVVEQANDAWI